MKALKLTKVFLSFAILLFLISGCGENKPTSASVNPESVSPEDRTSIFALIIDPEAYNEQTVTVRGAVSYTHLSCRSLFWNQTRFRMRNLRSFFER